MKYKQKKNYGITLIALVITISILVILAGVTIATLKNTNLFNSAIKAKEKSDYEAAKESMNIKLSAINTDYEMHGNGEDKLEFTAERLDPEKDDDIEYVRAEYEEEASIQGIKQGKNMAKIYTKLKKYKDYEFGINSNIEIASINGKDINAINVADKLNILYKENVVDYWPLKENLNNSISGRDNMEEKTGKVTYNEGCAYIDGNCTLGTKNNYEFPNNFTLIFQFKGLTERSGYRYGELISQGAVGGYAYGNGFGINYDNYYPCYVLQYGNGVWKQTSNASHGDGISIVNTSNFVTMAVSWDGSYLKLYENGTLKLTATSFYQATSPLYINAKTCNDNGTLQCTYKNIVIYNRALTNSEIEKFEF